jgi:hypothetical protein
MRSIAGLPLQLLCLLWDCLANKEVSPLSQVTYDISYEGLTTYQIHYDCKGSSARVTWLNTQYQQIKDEYDDVITTLSKDGRTCYSSLRMSQATHRDVTSRFRDIMAKVKWDTDSGSLTELYPVRGVGVPAPPHKLYPRALYEQPGSIVMVRKGASLRWRWDARYKAYISRMAYTVA